jgi:3-(3-hydroxy-phenyl)propionate hydroxylase
LIAARSINAALDGDTSAVDHFATTRRDAALYNRDASSRALQHMQANGWTIRWKRRLMAMVAKRGIAAGAWLDSSPFGPRAAAHKTETGSY